MPGHASNEERQRVNREECSHNGHFSNPVQISLIIACTGWVCSPMGHLEEQIKGSSIAQVGQWFHLQCNFFNGFWVLGYWRRMLLKSYWSSVVGKAVLTQNSGLMCYCSNPLLCCFSTYWSSSNIGHTVSAWNTMIGNLRFKSWLRLLSDFHKSQHYYEFYFLISKKWFMQTSFLLWILNEVIYTECLV